MIVTYENLKKAVPVLQEIEKAYLGTTPTDPLMSGQTEIFMSLGLENPKLMAQGFTEYRNIMARFQTDMGSIVSRFQSGTMSYSEAMKSWRTLTKDRYIDMFKAGTKAVGNPYYTDADIGLTRKDLSFINKARRAEAKHFQRFLRDIKDPLHGAPKGTPGRRIKVHDYMSRGGYYAKSAKAQMFNGMVAGAGQNLIIHWKLGTPQGDHCDVCPIYANRQWTWKTLPTVPRAGDTPCLFNCYCHLELTTRQGKRLGGDPDTGKSVFQPGGAPGVGTPQRSGQIRDTETGEVMDSKLPPDMAQEHEALRKSLNRYRQMIEVTEGDMLKLAIQARKQLNAKLIALQKQYPGLRFSPTMSVKDLVATVNIAEAKGGTFLLSIQDIQLGDEILLIRGTTSRAGKVVMDASGELVVEFADGTIVPLDAESDLVFRMRSNENTKVGGFTAESFKKFASIAEAEAYALKHFADRVDFSGGTLEQVNGFMRALHESKANFKWANDKLTEVAIVTGKNYRSGLINILPRKYISNACFVPKGKGCIYLGKNVHKDFSNKLLLDNLKTLEINQKFYEGKIASYKELVKKFESKFGANIQNITQVRKAGADYREWTEYKSNINQIKIYQDELDKVPYQRKEIQFKLDNRIDDNVLVKDHTCWNFADDIETQARVIVNHEMGHAMHSWYQTEVNQFWGKMGTKYGMANKYTLMDELSPTLRYQAEKITQPTKMISEIMAETFNFFKEGKWNYMKKDWVDFWQSMMTDATAIENTMKTF